MQLVLNSGVGRKYKMKTMWSEILKTFSLYNSTSLIYLFFILAIVYLWITEKEKKIRIVLIYTSLSVLAVFFCPITQYVLLTVIGDSETYYRFLWLVPTYLVCGYAAMKLMIRQKDWIRKTIIMITTCLIIIMNGSYVYDNEMFTKTENMYQLPQIVIDICESVEVEGREVKVVAPREFLQYIRQYSPYVHLAYGREMLIVRWNKLEKAQELHDAIEEGIIDIELVTRLSREQGCHYIIVNESKADEEEFAKYNYELHDIIQGYPPYHNSYYIYVDSQAYLGL